ncbi:uncharacterized protein LOC112091702 [Morus notabilis]|uniref:uncharacterized protein LOC112091702 n=1 Tax=Morus notabilis TaxID=981085 RepID=UPI000CED2EDF|nr:uncharacterized protein LOC112091702 [Morus notabilis]
MFQMLQTVGQFSGIGTEDPHLHLTQFMEVSDTFKITGVTEDALRLKLFPYSLRDRARVWLNSLPPDSVVTWDDLAEKFLMKYFPPTKNAKLRNDITSFQQADGESLYEAWERFKELLGKCPQHGIPHWIQIETFYNGLNGQTRTIVDAAARGVILAKSYNEAYEILERMTNSNYQWPTERLNARKASGIHEVDAITAFSAQMSSLTNMVKALHMLAGVNVVQTAGFSCVYCGEGHLYEDCPSNPASAYYVANFNRSSNPYSNPHHQGLSQHPNMAWSNQGAGSSGANAYYRPTYPPGYSHQQQRIQADQSSSLESLLKEFIARSEAKIQSHDATLRNLENQMEQLANSLNNRPQGSLPSNTEDPRREGKEHCKAISLRSGKELDPRTRPQAVQTEPTSIQEEEQQTQPQEEQRRKQQPNSDVQNAASFPQHSGVADTSNSSSNRPPPPFPRRFQRQQQDGQFHKFLDVLKQLHINIPLVEALEKMPNYTKFVKELVTKKCRFGEFEMVALTEECSAILQNKLPPKLKDPGSFTIPCSIGN